MSRPAFVRALVGAFMVGSVLGIPLGFAMVYFDRLFPDPPCTVVRR